MDNEAINFQSEVPILTDSNFAFFLESRLRPPACEEKGGIILFSEPGVNTQPAVWDMTGSAVQKPIGHNFVQQRRPSIASPQFDVQSEPKAAIDAPVLGVALSESNEEVHAPIDFFRERYTSAKLETFSLGSSRSSSVSKNRRLPKAARCTKASRRISCSVTDSAREPNKATDMNEGQSLLDSARLDMCLSHIVDPHSPPHRCQNTNIPSLQISDLHRDDHPGKILGYQSSKQSPRVCPLTSDITFQPYNVIPCGLNHSNTEPAIKVADIHAGRRMSSSYSSQISSTTSSSNTNLHQSPSLDDPNRVGQVNGESDSLASFNILPVMLPRSATSDLSPLPLTQCVNNKLQSSWQENLFYSKRDFGTMPTRQFRFYQRLSTAFQRNWVPVVPIFTQFGKIVTNPPSAGQSSSEKLFDSTRSTHPDNEMGVSYLIRPFKLRIHHPHYNPAPAPLQSDYRFCSIRRAEMAKSSDTEFGLPERFLVSSESGSESKKTDEYNIGLVSEHHTQNTSRPLGCVSCNRFSCQPILFRDQQRRASLSPYIQRTRLPFVLKCEALQHVEGDLNLFVMMGGKDMLALDWLPFVSRTMHYLLSQRLSTPHESAKYDDRSKRNNEVVFEQRCQVQTIDTENVFAETERSIASATPARSTNASKTVSNHVSGINAFPSGTIRAIDMRLMSYFNVGFVLVEYPGYGQSNGRPSPQGCVESALMAVQNALQILSCSRRVKLYLVGYSLGSAVALRVASKIGHALVQQAPTEDDRRSVSDWGPDQQNVEACLYPEVADCAEDRSDENTGGYSENSGSVTISVEETMLASPLQGCENSLESQALDVQSASDDSLDGPECNQKIVVSVTEPPALVENMSVHDHVFEYSVARTPRTDVAPPKLFRVNGCEETSPEPERTTKKRKQILSESTLSKIDLKTVALLAPFTTTEDCAASLIGLSQAFSGIASGLFSFLTREAVRWNNLETIKELVDVVERNSHVFKEPIQLTLFHGTDDTLVPFWMSEKLYKCAKRTQRRARYLPGELLSDPDCLEKIVFSKLRTTHKQDPSPSNNQAAMGRRKGRVKQGAASHLRSFVFPCANPTLASSDGHEPHTGKMFTQRSSAFHKTRIQLIPLQGCDHRAITTCKSFQEAIYFHILAPDKIVRDVA